MNKARKGFEEASERPPDLVITALQIPGMTGIEPARRLRATPQTADVPVLMITSRGHRVSPEELADTNARALVPKPFSPGELVEAVQSPLEGRDQPATCPHAA